MAKMNEFERCIQERRLIKIKPSKEMIHKELTSAEYDLERARHSLHEEDCKWTVVQSYYAMFHAAKALVLKKGFREKSHFCLIVALRELYRNDETFSEEMIDNFELCMHLRHEADYGLVYSQESAEQALKYADIFLNNTLTFLEQD